MVGGVGNIFYRNNIAEPRIRTVGVGAEPQSDRWVGVGDKPGVACACNLHVAPSRRGGTNSGGTRNGRRRGPGRVVTRRIKVVSPRATLAYSRRDRLSRLEGIQAGIERRSLIEVAHCGEM